MTKHFSTPGRVDGYTDVQSPLSWFLLFTKPAGERKAQINLERQGYRSYYPRLLWHARQRGRWVEQVVSLFPRYVFVQLDMTRQSLGPVRSTVGVVNLVRFGPVPAIVPDSMVNGLMRRADPETGLHRLSPGRPFGPGTRVNVVAGAFQGLDGIFEREAGNERVVVLLNLLGQHTLVSVPARYVVAA